MSYFKAADGTELFYAVWGTGHPILFVHGGNVGSEIWEAQIQPLLERGFQCIVYDQRGFGRSDTPGTGYEFDTLACDLDCLIRHLNLRRLPVAAMSFGGGVLARYLSRYGSAKVDRAVLVSTVLPYFLKADDNPDGVDRAIMYEPFRAATIADRPKILRESLPAFFNHAGAENEVSEAMEQWLLDLALDQRVAPALELYRTSSETDFRDDLRAFTMPTLLVHGDADVFAPPAATVIPTQRQIAGSRLEMYAGASHGLVFTHRERFNRAIASFLKCDLM
jgi:non-heme chloroperoxidase